MSASHYSFEPDWCIRPGLTLAEAIADLHLPSRAIERLTGLGPERLAAILAGEPITETDAEGLARIPIFPSARFWLALEHNYRAALGAGRRDVSNA